MKKAIKLSVGTFVMGMFAFAPLALAGVEQGSSVRLAHADIESGINVVGVAGVKSVDIEVKANAETNIVSVTAVGVKSDDDTNDDIKKSEDDDDSRSTTTQERGIENAKLRANENALDALVRAEIHIELEDDDEGDDVDEVEDVARVHSEAEFRGFVSHKSKEDGQLKSVSIKSGKVEVEHEQRGKWFGFMKGDLTAKATADVSGNVEVKYPWYHIFMTKTHSSASLRAQIAQAIAAERKGEKEGVASTTVRADISAAFGIPNLFEIIADTLKVSAAVKVK